MPTQTININVSTVGASILNTASPSAVTWIRVNADNTITYRSAAQTLSDLGAGVGTVTSVAMTVPTGLTVSGSPITGAGTLAVTLTAGYVIPTTTDETNWNTAYTNRITSLTTLGTSGAATLIANTLNIPQYQAAGTYVTAVSVATANGFQGSSSGGATPAITLSTSLTQNSVPFIGGAGAISEDATNFIWNNTSKKLSIYGADTMTVNAAAITSHLQVHGADGLTEAEIEVHRHGDTAAAGTTIFGARSRGTSGTPTIVQSGDAIWNITAVGFDGTDYASSSQIQMEVDGTPGANDMPGRIVFNTSPDGSQTLTERMRIASDGNVTINTKLTLGVASTTTGQQVFLNSTNANTLTINSGVTSASYALTLPTAQGGASTYLKNDGAGVLSWATVASGISIGDAIGNSPVTGSALMAIGGVITQAISYRAQQATPFSTAFGFETHNSGSFSGVYNSAFGWQAGKATTTALGSTAIGAFALTAQTTASGVGYNTAVGYQALASITTGYNNTGIGRDAGWNQTTANECVFIGRRSGWSANGDWNTAVGNYSMLGASGGSYVTSLGAGAANNGFSYAIALGAGALNSAANELMIGGDANGTIGSAGLGITNVCIGNNNTSTTAASVTIRTTGGSGSNNAAGIFTIRTGASTGTASTATLRFQTGTVLASGSTAQTMVSRLIFSQGAVTTDASTATWADALDFVFGTTTGTKIGTATTQKIGFWNATPLAQQTTASAAATFVANTSLIANDTATFDGYTLGQVVKVLRNLGILA